MVLRERRPAPLMTRELRSRAGLTRLEWLRVYWPRLLPALALLLVAAGIAAICLVDSAAVDVASSVGVALGVVGTVAGAIWADDMGSSSGALTLRERRRQVRLDRYRRGRRHAQDDLARLKELDHAYPRFSTQLVRDGSDVVVQVLEHEYTGRLPLIPWKATVRKLGHSAGVWAEFDIKTLRVAQPTVERVAEALESAQVIAEALENARYQEALKEHRLDVMVLAMQPPPASARAQAVVHREEIEAELESLCLDEGEPSADPPAPPPSPLPPLTDQETPRARVGGEWVELE